MGKLLDIYGKDKDREYRRVDLVFPVAEETAILHRPSTDEAEEIESSYKTKTDHIDIWKATYVMKFLSDEPNLRDADDIELYNAVYALELPDRKAILDVWEGMQGNVPDTLKDMMGAQLFREMNERKA